MCKQNKICFAETMALLEHMTKPNVKQDALFTA